MEEKAFAPYFKPLDGQWHLHYHVTGSRGERLSTSYFADPTLEGLLVKVAHAHVQCARALDRTKKMLKD
jgi:hypothetical protein